jgi:hypothetical protein
MSGMKRRQFITLLRSPCSNSNSRFSPSKADEGRFSRSRNGQGAVDYMKHLEHPRE